MRLGRPAKPKAVHEDFCAPTGSYDKRDADAPRSYDAGPGRFAGGQIAIAGDPGASGVGCGSSGRVRRGGAGPIPQHPTP